MTKLVFFDIDVDKSCGYLRTEAQKKLTYQDAYYLRITKEKSSILHQQTITKQWLMHTCCTYTITMAAPMDFYFDTRGARRRFRTRKQVARLEFHVVEGTDINMENLPPLLWEWIQTNYTNYDKQQATVSQ